MKALTLTVRNSRFSGFGGAVQILSTANVDTLNVAHLTADPGR